MSQLERRAFLLDRITRTGGQWPTGRVTGLYRANGIAPCRTTARQDLQYWVRRGRLAVMGPVNGRYFVLSAEGGQS